jgi:hypothetical protein
MTAWKTRDAHSDRYPADARSFKKIKKILVPTFFI